MSQVVAFTSKLPKIIVLAPAILWAGLWFLLSVGFLFMSYSRGNHSGASTNDALVLAGSACSILIYGWVIAIGMRAIETSKPLSLSGVALVYFSSFLVFITLLWFIGAAWDKQKLDLNHSLREHFLWSLPFLFSFILLYYAQMKMNSSQPLTNGAQ